MSAAALVIGALSMMCWFYIYPLIKEYLCLQLKKNWWGILVSGCVSVHLSICASVCPFIKNYAY